MNQFAVADNLSTEFQGRAAELRVCLDFVVRGYAASLNSFLGAPADLLVDFGKGRVVRVQVKSTMRLATGRSAGENRSPRYRFSLKARSRERYEKIDLYAFVAFDSEEVLYIPASEFRLSRQLSYLPGAFQKLAKGSLDRFLASWSLTD